MAKQANLIDYNLSTPERNSSLRNSNRAISTRVGDEEASFKYNYESYSSPDRESPTRKNYRTYPYDYFSGIDAKVFFGDVWVDDIVTIQYTVNQNKIPIYGYASQLYDAVARGTVIVQGTLTVAFKEMGYLNLVQRIIENQRRGAKAALEAKVRELAEKADKNKLEFIPNLQGTPDRAGNTLGLAGVGFAPNGTAQIIRQGETIESILLSRKGGNVVSSGLSAILYNEPNPNGNRDFEDFAEVMEDTIWGDSNGRPLGKKLKFRRADEFDYTYSALGEDTGGIIVGRDDYADTLNILLTFGDINDFRAEHTVMSINDVHFVSQGVLLSPTGDPIGETYNFFARDINQSITASTFNVPKIKFDIGDGAAPSSLDDVRAVEDYISFKKTARSLSVKVKASFSEGDGWTTEGLPSEDIAFDSNVGFNRYEPVIDQVIRIVERVINDPAYSALDYDFSQHILEVELDFPDVENNIGTVTPEPDLMGTVIPDDLNSTIKSTTSRSNPVES